MFLNTHRRKKRINKVERLPRRLMIVDCDVPQGDGTVAISVDDATVLTFPVHAPAARSHM
jgi:acetoin utilization deacetylase AcuC-like enzyme